MESKLFLFVALFATPITVILSNPQAQLAVEPQEQQPQPQQDILIAIPKPQDDTPGASPVLDASNIPQYNPLPRTFGSLFNLSAYLAGAPANQASLTFVPLITLLSAIG